ncbi:hypothetical protein PI124_g21052 [Phytophthora idaei]|nr:hypothetical protein PI124_g21052 [Phytophthora idaei]
MWRQYRRWRERRTRHVVRVANVAEAVGVVQVPGVAQEVTLSLCVGSDRETAVGLTAAAAGMTKLAYLYYCTSVDSVTGVGAAMVDTGVLCIRDDVPAGGTVAYGAMVVTVDIESIEMKPVDDKEAAGVQDVNMDVQAGDVAEVVSEHMVETRLHEDLRYQLSPSAMVSV